jgi:hypothetical protein
MTRNHDNDVAHTKMDVLALFSPRKVPEYGALTHQLVTEEIN